MNHELVAEAAVVGMDDELKGEVPVAFVVKADGADIGEADLKMHVRTSISPLSVPSAIHFVNDLPKTRSGKIMRRLLRKKLRGEDLGDTSTLVNPESVN